MWRRVLFGAQLAVSLVLLAALFKDFEWAAFWQLATTLPAWFYGLSFAAVLAGQVLYAGRWHLFLRSVGVTSPFRVVVGHYMVGVFFNNFLPSTVGGDWSKVYYLGRTAGYVRVTASVLADRLLGVFLVATLATVLVWTTAVPWPDTVAIRLVLTAIWILLLGLLLAPVLAPDAWLVAVASKWRALDTAARRTAELVRCTRVAVRGPAALVGAGLVVLGYLAILGLVYQEFVRLSTGTTPRFLAILATVTTIATLSNVPVAVNGHGLREQLNVALLAGFGLSREASAGISLLLVAHGLVVSVAGAVVWLRRRWQQDDLPDERAAEHQGLAR
jgi:uncharacterized membrane protein YbhN (UPF0104 family)